MLLLLGIGCAPSGSGKAITRLSVFTVALSVDPWEGVDLLPGTTPTEEEAYAVLSGQLDAILNDTKD